MLTSVHFRWEFNGNFGNWSWEFWELVGIGRDTVQTKLSNYLDELRQAAGQCPLAWLDRMRDRYEVRSEWWNLATEIIEFQ